MTFDALQTLNDIYLAGAPGVETIEFREVGGGSTIGEWEEIQAFVIAGDPDNDRMIGSRGGMRKPPLRVQIFKSAVPEIREQKDQIRRGGEIYTIDAILQEGASWWVVYCAR